VSIRNLKVKKIKIVKAVIVGILIIVLVSSFIYVINLKEILGIGFYRASKDFKEDLSEGWGGIELQIYATQVRYSTHDYGIRITLYASENVDILGFDYLNYTISTQSSVKHILLQNYTIPTNIAITVDDRTNLDGGDVLRCFGFADVSYNVSGSIEMIRIYFDLGILISVSGISLNYLWDNALIWIHVIYFSLICLLTVLFFRYLRSIKFDLWYSEELKKHDDIFLKHLDEMHLEENPKNTDNK
jgi:hypothetical protein